MTAAITQRPHPKDCLCLNEQTRKQVLRCSAEWGPDLSVIGRRIFHTCTRPAWHDGHHYSCQFGWWPNNNTEDVAEKINDGLKSSEQITKALALTARKPV